MSSALLAAISAYLISCVLTFCLVTDCFSACCLELHFTCILIMSCLLPKLTHSCYLRTFLPAIGPNLNFLLTISLLTLLHIPLTTFLLRHQSQLSSADICTPGTTRYSLLTPCSISCASWPMEIALCICPRGNQVPVDLIALREWGLL